MDEHEYDLADHGPDTEDLALSTDVVELLRGRLAELERRFGLVSRRNGELLDLCNAKDRRIVELETRLAHAHRDLQDEEPLKVTCSAERQQS